MYDYFDRNTHLANNMYNAALFRIRQVMTAMRKEPEELFENEKEILDEIRDTLPRMGSKFKMPTKEQWLLSYEFLDALCKRSKNPDYCAERFSRHCAQHEIRNAVENMYSFFKAMKVYNADSASFTGKPKLPGYKKSGGKTTVFFTNQVCSVIGTDNGFELKFPYTKKRLELGKNLPEEIRLKQVTVKPYHDIFTVSVVLSDDKDAPEEALPEPHRICAIDLGVNNFAAITNNIGQPCLLFKGGIVKSANQWYNKRCAEIQSEQTAGTEEKFQSTPEYRRICIKRHNILEDFMHKTAKKIVLWCRDNSVDTIVVGHTKGWKQESSMGKKNNQEFVQIPFHRFQFILQYQCTFHGIRYVLQEESYTSKASFMMMDEIPVYGQKNADGIKFSGSRCPKRFRNMYSSRGFHGLYKNIDGSFVNADLNGSANIGRKAFPELFTKDTVDLSHVLIFKHPSYM